MTLPSLATVTELASWLDIDIDDEDARAALILESASGLVRTAAGQTWVDEEESLTDVPTDARSVVLASAARAWVNPTGASQTAAGPFQTHHQSGLFLTDDERSVLGQFRTQGVAGLWTLSTTRGDLETKRIAVNNVIDAPGGAIAVTEIEDY